MTPIERLDPNKRLALSLGVPLRNRGVLTNLLEELYDPHSPQFRQYVTPEQFTEMFGPTLQEYQAVMDFAASQGFTIKRMHLNRVILDVEAPVANVEKAFHIALQRYQHPTEPRTFYAPNVEPSVEGAVPILDISGLDDYKLPRPLVHKLEKSSLAGP